MFALPTLRTVARGAAGVAGLTGLYGSLSLLGAFGPVSCWTARSAGSDGVVTTTRGCEAGIDYLLGRTGGNAPVLFFWALALLGLVALGVAAVRTGRRRVTWATALAGAVVSVLGLMSIGWYFMVPTLSLLVAAAALTAAARAEDGGGSGAMTGS
jgi:hypothetical protein